MRLIVLPNLELYLRLLNPELSPETQHNEMKRYEAWRVYGALQVPTPYFHLQIFGKYDDRYDSMMGSADCIRSMHVRKAEGAILPTANRIPGGLEAHRKSCNIYQ